MGRIRILIWLRRRSAWTSPSLSDISAVQSDLVGGSSDHAEASDTLSVPAISVIHCPSNEIAAHNPKFLAKD
eukprot:753472-Hanusia_phi.AAC.3